MKKGWITPNNVTKISHRLLQMDRTDIQAAYQSDITEFVHPLQQALKEYQNPPQSEGRTQPYHTIEKIERSLKHLMEAVNTVVGLLTPEAQQHLEKSFNPSPTGTHHAITEH